MNPVEDWIFRLPPDLQSLAAQAREIILNQNQKISEKISFGVPFYSYLGWMVYISVHKGGLDITFLRGHELSDTHQILDARNRTMVKSLHIPPGHVIPTGILRETLQEAMLLNEETPDLKPGQSKKNREREGTKKRLTSLGED
ncbi:MAG: DUF1801 domain-containing protein [Bacteroidetes bacterium]|nr:DUF1801 domain-containing protein [Bacteroidota bacterium]